jgi:hypothetical protein
MLDIGTYFPSPFPQTVQTIIAAFEERLTWGLRAALRLLFRIFILGSMISIGLCMGTR